MSLINQMLQELDARRASVTGTETYGQQVRAVPDRRGMHPAWWVVLALAVVLCGLLAWIVLRPPVSGKVLEPNAQLPLKLDIDLNAAPAPAKKLPPTEPAQKEVTPLPATDVSAVKNSVPFPPVPMAKETAPAAPAAPVKIASPMDTSARNVPPNAPEVAALVMINKQVKELTPQQRAENEYRKSVALLQQGRQAEAGGSLEQALQLDPHHVAARQTLIGLLLDNKRQDEALRLAREGLELDSAQPGLAMILARLQVENGELRAAIDTLERTLAHADRADYHAFLAALLQRDDRHKQAAEHYRLALQKAPQNGVWWMGFGISLQADHRTAEAQDAFRRAKASNSLSPDLLGFVEARLVQLGR